jgi:ABC-2 type transport system ATP-binding protein
MIEAQQLTKRYAGRTAVDSLSFRVEPGEIIGFLGPNGAGKSTTMRMLAGYLPPTSGRAWVNGHCVFAESLKVRQSIGYMPEMAPLYADMRIKEYLRFRAELKGLSGLAMRRRVDEVMELCSVQTARRRLIANLSKGFRQRVALADALLASPPLLILDEPTNGLDPVQIRQVRELLGSLRGTHTILLSTHILQEVEAVCDRVLMIHQGRLLAYDRPEALGRSLRTSSQLLLELKGPAEAMQDLLASLPGVRRVQAQGDADCAGFRRLSLRLEPEQDPRLEVHALVVREGWELRQLQLQPPSLEDVFVELASMDRLS